MVAILRLSSFRVTLVNLQCSSRGRKHRIQRQVRKREQLQNPRTLGYPKSSPTPILLNRRPFPQTKLQALDAVVNELEGSIRKGIRVDAQIFASLLETCYLLNSIDHGVRIHRLIPMTLLRKNVGISSKLLRLYASCGRVETAHEVFDEMSKRDESPFPWNSLVSGYAELGQYEDALAIYFQMDEEGVEPDQFTFPRVLKACSGMGLIQVGEEVHRRLIRKGLGDDGFALNALVDMYAKCGDIVKARRVFDKIPLKDAVSWNSMLTGYLDHGLLLEALKVFNEMLYQGFQPDSVAISKILSSSSSLKFGLQTHGWVLRQGIECNLSVVNALITLYSHNGKLQNARWLFAHMPERDIVSWNSIISGHCKHHEALSYFKQMRDADVSPDSITFVSTLSACAHLGLVEDGERLFFIMAEKYSIRPGMEHYACLVNLYGRAGLINESYKVITERMEYRAGPMVWGALLYACYVHRCVDVAEIAAQNLFELEPDNEYNFELLMKIYRNAGRADDVERVKKMMLDRGL